MIHGTKGSFLINRLHFFFLLGGKCDKDLVCNRYVKRKAREGFRAHQGETDAQTISQLVQDAKAELEVVKRQSVVYGLYARKQKSIMVCILPAMQLTH